jgi:hypothetical protein
MDWKLRTNGETDRVNDNCKHFLQRRGVGSVKAHDGALHSQCICEDGYHSTGLIEYYSVAVNFD